MAETTLLQIRNKIKADLDLEDELFITDSEINSHINSAIRDVEADIHSIYEDYFLTSTTLSLVNGTSTYSLPSDIYADKIRAIQYNDGSTKYDIQRVRDLSLVPYIDNNDFYRYIITNSNASGRQIKLYPTSRETNSTAVTVWYIRNAKELSLDADVIDIPEFYNYVFHRAKLSIYLKEGNPMAAELAEEVKDIKMKMIETLSNRVVDDDNKILIDTTFYNDFE